MDKWCVNPLEPPIEDYEFWQLKFNRINAAVNFWCVNSWPVPKPMIWFRGYMLRVYNATIIKKIKNATKDQIPDTVGNVTEHMEYWRDKSQPK